jgi:hypothetical protein
MESGFPLTAVQALYCAVESKDVAAIAAVYPLWMQVVVSCSHFTDGAELSGFLLGN